MNYKSVKWGYVPIWERADYPALIETAAYIVRKDKLRRTQGILEE